VDGITEGLETFKLTLDNGKAFVDVVISDLISIVCPAWVMDNCELIKALPLKEYTIPGTPAIPGTNEQPGTPAIPAQPGTPETPGYKQLVPNIYVTGGSTYVDDCYKQTLPTLIIPLLNAVPSACYPRASGSFDPPYFPLDGQFKNHLINNNDLPNKLIYYRVVTSTSVIAYCYFDNDGNALPKDTQCAIKDPDSRSSNSTFEFPLGTRFVTHDVLVALVNASESGNGRPISKEVYEDVAPVPGTDPTDEIPEGPPIPGTPGTPAGPSTRAFYGQDYEYVQRNRICKAVDTGVVSHESY